MLCLFLTFSLDFIIFPFLGDNFIIMIISFFDLCLQSVIHDMVDHTIVWILLIIYLSFFFPGHQGVEAMKEVINIVKRSTSLEQVVFNNTGFKRYCIYPSNTFWFGWKHLVIPTESKIVLEGNSKFLLINYQMDGGVGGGGGMDGWVGGWVSGIKEKGL